MQYYWTGGDVKKAEAEIFKGITLHGRYDVVEQAFAEAATLAPERIDFLFDVASSQILLKKVDEAQATYQAILDKDPNSFEAQAWLEALARASGDETSGELAIKASRRSTASARKPIASVSCATRRSWRRRRTRTFPQSRER